MYQLYYCKLPQKMYALLSKFIEIHGNNTRNTNFLYVH